MAESEVGMKLLVTGGSGFLGSRIVKACQDGYRERHRDECRYARRGGERDNREEELSGLFSGKYSVYAPEHNEMDILDSNSIEAVFEKIRPEAVVHCAAASDVGWCGQYQEESWRMNVEGTENMAKACDRWKAKLLYCSSDQVYFGSRIRDAHKETEGLNPANEYGRQKLEAEKRCLAYCEDSVILRLSWMYDTARIGNKEHGNFMQTFLQAVKNGEKMAYPVYDYRGITDVSLVVKNLEKALALPSGVYNYGSENNYSTYETVYRLLKKTGLSAEKLEKNEEAFAAAPRNLRMNMEKLQESGILFPETLEQLIAVVRSQRL